MRKYLIISLLASYSIIFAGESEDFKAVDNLYKERNFKAALVESEKFLQKYPESKHQKSMRDKVAKIYFLEKNYKKAEEIFKRLYTIEEKQSQKDEYASYLARANALLNNSNSAMFYLREIKDEKTFQKTFFAVAQNFLAKENNEAAQKAYKEIIDKFVNSDIGKDIFSKKSIKEYQIKLDSRINPCKSDHIFVGYVDRINQSDILELILSEKSFIKSVIVLHTLTSLI